MAFKTPGRMRIPQWSIINRLLTAENITYDQYGKEVANSRVRTDLTGAIVYFTVRDNDDNIVIQKDSTNAAEIEIKSQIVESTKGQATVHFVYDDTAPLSNDPSVKYWFDSWAMLANGLEEPIVDRGRFYVDKSATHIAAGPAPALPTYPAAQNQQEQSFKWTATSTGASFVVPIPVTMANAIYCVVGTYSFIPAIGVWSAMYIPEASRTDAEFLLETNVDITIGTVIDFIVRDA